MKSFDVGYKVGYLIGVAFVYGLYLLGIVSFVYEIYMRQLPILSLTFLFVIGIWKKLMQIDSKINLNATVNEKIAILNELSKRIDSKNNNVDKVMNIINNNKFGGPNGHLRSCIQQNCPPPRCTACSNNARFH